MTEFKEGDHVEFMDGRTGTVDTVRAGLLVVRLDGSGQLIQSGKGGFKILRFGWPSPPVETSEG